MKYLKTAMELQTETKIRNKGDYQFGLDEGPPTRVLSLILALCAWLGWIIHEKHGSSEEHPFSPRACLRMIQEDYVGPDHRSCYEEYSIPTLMDYTVRLPNSG